MYLLLFGNATQIRADIKRKNSKPAEAGESAVEISKSEICDFGQQGAKRAGAPKGALGAQGGINEGTKGENCS